MIELIRNCSHGSEIAVYFITNPSYKFVRKISYSHAGIQDLRREAMGWQWYQDQRKPINPPLCKSDGNNLFHKNDIIWIDGEKGNYHQGLSPNLNIIKRAIEHYFLIWPNNTNGLVPMHGDFSIDNIIINNHGVYMIDWEHFIPDKSPLGLDPLYLIFESLWFTIKDKRIPNERELNSLLSLIKQIITKNPTLMDGFNNKPLHGLRSFITKNISMWGEQLAINQNKLPVLLFSEEQVSEIDLMIKNNLDGEL